MSSAPPLFLPALDDAGGLASLAPRHLTIVAADKGSVLIVRVPRALLYILCS